MFFRISLEIETFHCQLSGGRNSVLTRLKAVLGPTPATAFFRPGLIVSRLRQVGQSASVVRPPCQPVSTVTDHGGLVSAAPDRLCRAELRVEGPLGTWTARFASPIFDEPAGLLWDTPGLIVVKYGFVVYGLDSRTGSLRWGRFIYCPQIAQRCPIRARLPLPILR